MWIRARVDALWHAMSEGSDLKTLCGRQLHRKPEEQREQPKDGVCPRCDVLANGFGGRR
jgi:hypothetical protein